MLTESGIAPSGTAESFLHASHITRTRLVHLLTLAVLYSLKQDAYLAEGIDDQSFEEWEKHKLEVSPQYFFWDLVMELELNSQLLVRSFREHNFLLYLQVLKRLVGWAFIFDHTHYRKDLLYHIIDMMNLDKNAKDVPQKFEQGYFVSQKSLH